MRNTRSRQTRDLARVAVITFFGLFVVCGFFGIFGISLWCILMSALLKCTPVPPVVWSIFVLVDAGATLSLMVGLALSTRDRSSDPYRYSPRILRVLTLSDEQVSSGIKKIDSILTSITESNRSPNEFHVAGQKQISGPPELAMFVKRRLFRLNGQFVDGAWNVVIECKPIHWIIFVDPAGLTFKGLDELLQELRWQQNAQDTSAGS